MSIHLHLIAYNAETQAKVAASGFEMLDNMGNERPDWYEYWPMRRYLLENLLHEDDWYGFFSPKFSDKTMLDHAAATAFIANAEATKQADVVLFSPQPDMGANFLSVFEQAEVFDHGFIAAAKDFLKTCGLDVPLEAIVMDARQTVFSNYFAAKPAFWREWFTLTEALFAICEDKSHPLNAALCHQTNYGVDAQRKVFLLERLASLLLVLRPNYKAVAHNPYGMGWSMSKFRQDPHQSYINDALKLAFKEFGYPQYMEAFNALRNKFIEKP